MLNKILNLDGAQKLTKTEQKSIIGGLETEARCFATCPSGDCCRKHYCVTCSISPQGDLGDI